jgi:hypothetical protein
LLENNHFNLIVVHTGVNDLAVPFNETLLCLMAKCPIIATTAEDIAEADAYLVSREDELAVDVKQLIRETFSYEQYFQLRNPKAAAGNRLLAKALAPFGGMNARLIELGIEPRYFTKVLLWAADDFERQHSAEFSDIEHRELTWSQRSDCLWIRSDKGFVAFAKKGQAKDLMDTLKAAIGDWKPSPSRMLSAKFRSELDEHGVVVEGKALSTRHVHAKFYDLILRGSENEQKSLVDSHIERYVEQLTSEIKDNIRTFALSIVASDGDAANPSGSYLSHYGVNLETSDDDAKATEHYNSFISTKNVSGWHLSSGHILAIGDERWVCLSPACDMYPGQRVVGITPENGGEIRPFLAAQLHKRRKPVRDSDQIQSNNFLFLQENGAIVTYSINAGGDADGDKTRLPNWQMFLGLNDGKLETEGNKKFLRVLSLAGQANAVNSSEVKVEVVAQLRYEYALNLINKLGSSMTRIGLDFIAPIVVPTVTEATSAKVTSKPEPEIRRMRADDNPST